MTLLHPAICALALALALPLSASAQFVSSKKMPSVARPGPGDKDCKRPAYPESSARNGDEGVVTLQYLVTKDGAILEGKVVKSSGFSALDKAALVELAKCAYEFPEGEEEPAKVTFKYAWSLE